VRTSFLPGLALWSLFPRPQSHGPTFWTVFYGKRLVNAEIVQVRISTPGSACCKESRRTPSRRFPRKRDQDPGHSTIITSHVLTVNGAWRN
jgi:hypothetical protein